MIKTALTLPVFDFSEEINNLFGNLEDELANENIVQKAPEGDGFSQDIIDIFKQLYVSLDVILCLDGLFLGHSQTVFFLLHIQLVEGTIFQQPTTRSVLMKEKTRSSTRFSMQCSPQCSRTWR
jgi:hypothetical protein